MSESLVRVSVPVFAGVVPGQVHLAPFAVDLYGVPGVAVAGDAAVGDARCVMELGAPAPEYRLQPDAEAETAMEPSRELARR